MKPSRIVFISGHRFGLAMLRGLLDARADLEVVSVLGLHPRYACDTVGYTDIAFAARQMGLQSVMFGNVKSEGVGSYLRACSHDYLFAIGLSQLVPPAILNLPAAFNSSDVRNASTHGCIGAHPSLLPEGRGRAPIPWTLIHGLSRSGVTAFFLEDEADSGALIDQVSFDIARDETATTLFAKAEDAHYKLGERLAQLCAARSLPAQEESDREVSSWPRRTARDGWLDFARPARHLVRLVRALQPPYPLPFVVYRDSVIPVASAEVLPAAGLPTPGLVLAHDAQTIKVWAADAPLALRIASSTTSGIPPEGTRLTTNLSETLDA